MIYIQGNPVNTKPKLMRVLFLLRDFAVNQGPNASPEMILFRNKAISLIQVMTNPATQDQCYQEYLLSPDWHL